MSNAYSLATCILVVRRCTAVIEALFGSIAQKFETALPTDAMPCPEGFQMFTFHLEDGDGISDIEPIHEALRRLHLNYGLSRTSDDLPAEDALRGLCAHFELPDHPVIAALEAEMQNGQVNIETLGQLAEALDDGHDLWSLSVQEGYWADRPTEGNFGGFAQYRGSHFAGAFGTSSSLAAARDLQTMLSQADISAAAKVVSVRVRGILAAIRQKNQRAAVLAQLCLLLAEGDSVEQPSEARTGSVPHRYTSVVISTAHVPDKDEARNYLAAKGDAIEYGWLWKVPPLLVEIRDCLEVPDWLQPVLAFADAEGIDRIEFDSDGELIEGLPIYEHD
ncbi:MAG: hypothetical protein E2591_26845 [Achromobacter sp.]|uniref:DUF5983 family protein n=1 Tax=Achromobacter sp. TaxID=134375 RepID=UPI0012C36EA3|nr:hypothetical protein [Achromobacter sp.]MPS81697.1 hypothetical protein [Achromobacter sp.]